MSSSADGGEGAVNGLAKGVKIVLNTFAKVQFLETALELS